MFHLHKSWILCISFALATSAIDIESVVNQCCNEGNEWGSQRKHCNEYKFNLDTNVVPPGFHGLCLSTVEICCAKQHRIYQCTAGSVAAKSSSSCDNSAENYGTEFFKDCCEACKIGLVIGSTSQQCSTEGFSFGSPWDDIIEDCCTDIRENENENDENIEDKNICQQINNLCTQICVPTKDNSYVCQCHDGYVLLEDTITCVKKEMIDNNISTENNSSECEKGFSKNIETGECEDINECDTGEANCNIENQACLNTRGSFKCLDILVNNDRDRVSQCEEGYRYQARIDQCVDINECSEGLDDCNSQTQLCLNTKGGFKCQEKIDKIGDKCLPGLKFDEETKLCEDINECLLDPDSCDDGYKCINTIGSFECIKLSKKPSAPKCADGYQLFKNQCIDIDECLIDKDACDANQICTNLPGGFRCDCKIGFTLDPLTNACEDINECQVNNHECLESQRCDNTIGSYRCIRTQSCGTGYTFNMETERCDDDDECVLGTHNCYEAFECHNTKGSFRCIRKPKPTTTTTTTSTTTLRPYFSSQRYTSSGYNSQSPNNYDPRYALPCMAGFERNSLGACVDINECEVRNPCARNQKCINTNGAYRCLNSMTCQVGYELNADGNQCVDIDECENREAVCGPQQTCKNKPGGYTCACPEGFIASHRNCEDINECEHYKDRRPCPSNAECMNTIGSYRCHCKAGFKNELNDDRKCVDVDECQEYPGLCQHRCINYWGSYKCGCESGFKLNANNRTCDDIDECEVHKTYKLCVGICQNIPGSYRCTCGEGYRIGADSRSCEDIDECRETPHICRGRDDVCTNLRGSYRCIPIECPYGYMRDRDRKNRCKRTNMLCDHNDIDCFRKPTSYSYNFISMVPNMTIPLQGTGLFNLQTSVWSQEIDFDLTIINIHAPQHVQKVEDYYFSLNKSPQGATLLLMQPLDGPQDIELELRMDLYTQNRRPSGSSVAKIFVLVSEFPY